MTNITYGTFFATLSNGRRLEVLSYLNTTGPQTVTEIVDGTDIEQSAVSHILNKLQTCGIVHVKVSGRHRTYSVNTETIAPLFRLIDQHLQKFCQGRCNYCSATN